MFSAQPHVLAPCLAADPWAVNVFTNGVSVPINIF